MPEEIVLSKIDKLILRGYENMIDALSDYLGDGYELVLHSLENFDSSVIKIINGHYTGRQKGAPITNLGLSMLSQLKNENTKKMYKSYLAKNKKGEPIKATTILIKGENDKIIGMLCINFYLNTPISSIIDLFIDKSHINVNNEDYAENAENMVLKAVQQASVTVDADNTVKVSNRNKLIINSLYEMGIFKIKDSVVLVSKYLNISKNTVYLHLRALK